MAGVNPIKKFSKVLTVNPVISTGAYSSGQIIGGLVEMPDFFDSPSGVSELVDCEVFDGAKQNSVLTLVIFSSKPAGTYADAATMAPSLADLKLIDAVIPISTSSYASFSANSIATVANIRNKVQATYTPLQTGPNSKAKSAWVVLVSGGTPTYGAANAVQIQLGIEQDV